MDESARRRAVAAVPLAKKLLGRQAPTRQMGVGPPIFVGRGARRRLLADGGGLCSPGLWHTDSRLEPEGAMAELRQQLVQILHAYCDRDPGGARGFTERLLTGKVTSNPFDDQVIATGRRAIASASGPLGGYPAPPASAQTSEIQLSLLGRLARAVLF